MALPENIGASGDVELVEEELRGLKREREHLHSCGAEREVLERNRRAIVEAQRELAHALIARHGLSFQTA